MKDSTTTNFIHQKPRFCLPHGSHLHGGGLPGSHEGGRLRGGAPPWCRRQGSSSPRHRRRPALLAALSAVFTAISITNSSLYSVVHPPTNLCIALCEHGVWCYNISYDLCHGSIVYLLLDWIVDYLWFIRVVCWYVTVLWCPLYLCAQGSTS